MTAKKTNKPNKTKGLVKNSRPGKQKRQPLTPEKAFTSILDDTTRHMPLYQRVLSGVIHNKYLYNISELLGNTIARPTPLLVGSIISFALSISVYLLSKSFGYSMSGMEPIIGFSAGWTIGILYDLSKFIITRVIYTFSR